MKKYLFTGENEQQLLPLFEALKLRHPQLHPRFLMSDLADCFWNTWRKVFGDDARRLYCLWHCSRAWQSHINQVCYSFADKQVNDGDIQLMYIYKLYLLKYRNFWIK